MEGSYAALVGHAPARRLLYALATTTLSYGMLTLTVLLTVERATGSYRIGGFAVAAWAALSGVSAPIRGRLVDRGGRDRRRRRAPRPSARTRRSAAH